METNKFFKIEGDANTIKRKLSEELGINNVNAAILFSIIQQNQNILSDEEDFYKSSQNISSNNETLGFLTNNAKYFVNLKFLTLAFICLIFDIKIAQGGASFLLGLCGADCTLIKLEDMEKCVAYKIKAEKGLSMEQLIALTQCNFTYCNTSCGHCLNDGTCGIWEENNIKNTICSLMEKNIIKLKNGVYEIVF